MNFGKTNSILRLQLYNSILADKLVLETFAEFSNETEVYKLPSSFINNVQLLQRCIKILLLCRGGDHMNSAYDVIISNSFDNPFSQRLNSDQRSNSALNHSANDQSASHSRGVWR